MEPNGSFKTFGATALKSSDFLRVQRIMYDYCGIYLHSGKQALVRARLMKRMRKVGLTDFDEYLDKIEEEPDSREFLSFVDVLTTNKTDFFRENQHFHFLREAILPEMRGRDVRWWSAGCSSGEEPITMAITLLEAYRQGLDSSVKILATDISREILARAKAGVYQPERLKDIPAPIIERYFKKWRVEGSGTAYRVKDEILKMITYGRINLNSPWPLRGPFHVIMCRNVLIYFKRETQHQIVSRFHEILEPGGYLFLGHSESVAGQVKGFTNIRPSVYQKMR
jgi:chemotaxis protein methyltransferase CheR